MLKREPNKPVLTKEDVIPSGKDFRVDGIFNCGATTCGDETILLCRVAESCYSENENEIRIPMLDPDHEYKLMIKTLYKDQMTDYDFSDSRIIIGKKGTEKGKVRYLTSMSHLRIAKSRDGIHFTVDDKPSIMPYGKMEKWGIEDPRITRIEDTYYITYTSVSELGAGTSMLTTRDFKTFERKGMIFLPENKDTALFPQRIQGKYYCLNRPVPFEIGYPDIWMAVSDDLIHWGEYQHLAGITSDGWESGRIGGGTPPILTDKGWLMIYHAADQNKKYCLGAMLLDKENPTKVIGKTQHPFLTPEESYEVEGFFGNVVFTCGCTREKGILNIYYGAADDKIARAVISVDELLAMMEER